MSVSRGARTFTCQQRCTTEAPRIKVRLLSSSEEPYMTLCFIYVAAHVSAAKAGVDALSNVISVEEGPRGIRSNVIAPVCSSVTPLTPSIILTDFGSIASYHANRAPFWEPKEWTASHPKL